MRKAKTAPAVPLVLAFDTSAAHCAAALLRGDTLLAARAEEMGRGQAERLVPMLHEMLTGAGVTFADLAALGVGIGPGNFTGIRISVSAARGLALALEIPAIGVSTFDAISFAATLPHLPAVPAPRDQVYILAKDAEPALVPMSEAHAVGLPLALPPAPADMAVAMARIAQDRLKRARGAHPAPAPLYIRAADAAPARDAPPVMLPDDAG